MKLFFVIKSLNMAAGTERATTTIANELSLRDYEVGLVCLEKPSEPFFTVHPKVKLHYLYPTKDKRFSIVRDISRRRELKSLYKEEKPDIIIIVGSGRSLLNIPAARGIKNITWEHFNVNINWHLLHPLSKKLAAMYSDYVVTLTQQDALNFKNKFSAKNVICIPNSISIDNTTISPLTEKRVLAIGRYVHQKGYDYLIDAWRLVESREKGWKLRIIGTGKLMPEIKNKIAEYHLEDSIELVDSTNNVVEHYMQSTIYVMSSRYEGLPLVLIEAMSMGLPIVSFDCETGPRDIIVQDITGQLIPIFDVKKLALELNNLIKDEKKRKFYSENALKHVKKFETKVIVDQWEKLFKEISSK